MEVQHIVLSTLIIFSLSNHIQAQEVLRSHFSNKALFYKHADDYLKRRLYQKALNEYATVLSLYPDDFETLEKIANVYYKEKDWKNTERAYKKLYKISKEKKIVLRLYEAKKHLAEKDSLKLQTVKKEIKNLAYKFFKRKENRKEALSTAYELFFMADTDSIAIKPFKKAIVGEFPNSKTGYEIIGNDFYNGLYPIWYNDTLKVTFLENFLKKYPITEWRLTVYQYLLSSLFHLKKIDELESTGERMLKDLPKDPFVYNYLSYLLLESKKDIRKVIDYARKAIELEPKYQKPENLAPEQWQLQKKALYGNARMTLARALLRKGYIEESERWIKDALQNTRYGVDDYKTEGPYYYVLGNIKEKQNRLNAALNAYIMCLIEGDVRNKWTPKADSAMKRLLDGTKDEVNLISYARKSINYKGVIFEDATEKMGLSGIKTSRIAWGDYNNDGYDDILLNGSRIFKNIKGKKFVEVTKELGIGDYHASGGIWGDWNNDGLLDFYSISGGKGEKGDKLWKQTNVGKFIDVTKKAGGVKNDFSTEGAGWGDANSDGFLDLYLANYENWKEHSYYPDEFYLCKGGERFEEVSQKAGMMPPFNQNRAGRGVNWGDFDNDGDLDIFVSNYRLQENFLWRNNGDGTFTNVACLLGVAGDENDGWWGHTIGSSWGDYDNDGDLDLITANLAHPRYIEFSNKTKLYENLGPPDYRFVDRRAEAGIKYEETHSDPLWADFDGDGDLDLYITSVYKDRKSFLYENLGNGKFKDVTYLSATRVFNGWGCAASDFDNDGDVDLFVASGSGGYFFLNKGNGNNYLEIKVIGTRSNSSGIGTRITVKQDDRIQIREVQGGKGTTSENSVVQFFGFRKNEKPVTIDIRFPSGKKKHLSNVQLNQRITVKE